MKRRAGRRGRRSASAALPQVTIVPIDIEAVEIGGDGLADGREEIVFVELPEQLEALELVLYKILQLGEDRLDP